MMTSASMPPSAPSVSSDSRPSTHRHISHPPRPLSPGVASRLFFSMRKPFTHASTSSQRRKQGEKHHDGMYSTPEERHPYASSRATRSRYSDASFERPTIEQIAMGLHISRTPHLRSGNPVQRHSPMSTPSLRRIINVPNNESRVSSHSHPHVFHDSLHSIQQRPRHSLPPPPPRSSLKKASSPDSALNSPQQPLTLLNGPPSTSTITSAGPVTPDSWSARSLKLRMSKFIPGYRPSSTALSTDRASTFTSSGSDATRPTTPRKAVRFSTSVLALDELPS